VRCTDREFGIRWAPITAMAGISGIAGIALMSVLAGCSSPESPPSVAPPTARASTSEQARGPANAPLSRADGKPVAPVLPAPTAARTWNEFRHQAALRMVAANPTGTYTGDVVEPLLAIPVLEIDLNRDGSINRILVLREPHQAKDTTPLAVAAVRRAAPFGDVSRLPKPWRFAETFLFNDDRKFKPRTLDP